MITGLVLSASSRSCEQRWVTCGDALGRNASIHYMCDLNPQVRNCPYAFMNGQPPSFMGRKD
jgi:hypothetical protein